MGYHHFTFDISGFRDSRETCAAAINGIHGHALAQWLTQQLNENGVSVSEIWNEDHGWDFFATDANSSYLCSCSLATGGDALDEGHVTICKQRSVFDVLFCRNKSSRNDAILITVRLLLDGIREGQIQYSEY
jgi:hypothetical protein